MSYVATTMGHDFTLHQQLSDIHPFSRVNLAEMRFLQDTRHFLTRLHMQSRCTCGRYNYPYITITYASNNLSLS